MFTAESYEPFTLIGFVRTSWLISKRIVFFFFVLYIFLIKNLTLDLASIVYLCFRLFLIKKNYRLSFKFINDCLQFGLIGRVVLPLLIFQLMEYTIITSTYHLAEYTYVAIDNLAMEVEP